MLVAGIDVGNLNSKAVVIDGGEVVGQSVFKSAAASVEAAQKALEMALAPLGKTLAEVDYLVSTGSGRVRTVKKERVGLPFVQETRATATCVARGAVHLRPEARTVIDVGAQTAIILRLDERGAMRDVQENDKCAAGAGLFFDNMARRLKLSLDEMSSLSLEAAAPVYITSMCTMFAEQELISYFHQNPPPPLNALVAGLYLSIAQRVVGLVRRLGKVEEEVLMVGGVAKNEGFVRMVERELGVAVKTTAQPELTAALGAALIAQQAVTRQKAAREG